MKFRVLVLFGLLLLVVLAFAACGGGGGNSNSNMPQTLMITTTTLPQGIVNNSYSTTLQGTGGTGTYTWGVSAGSLPPGVTLNSMTAMITGTPTAAGTFNFTAQLMDGAGHTATAMLSLNVEGALLITCNSCAQGTTNLPVGMPGVPYSATLSATGGTTPYSWCVVEASGACDNGSGGALPAGLTISTQNNNGVISGTPTMQPAAPVSVTVQVSDSETIPAHGTLAVTLTIFSIVTKTLPNGIINQPYQAANGQPVDVIASGGVEPFTWCVLNSAGSCDPNQTELPPGLTLGPCVRKNTPICAITGTPTQLGLSTFTLQVTDGETPPAVTTSMLSIDVTDAVLRITTSSLPNGFVSLPYSAILQYTGGNGDNTWSIVSGSGSLPAGMSLNSTTGAISGTPTAAGTSTFVVQVQDTENPPQIATSPALSITVNAAIGNGTLNGNYAFTFSGYQNGDPVFVAGAFVADGSGNITGGELDLNNGAGEPDTGCSGGPQQQTITPASSTYSIQPNGLGTMTVVTNVGTYNFEIAIRPDGSGSLIQQNSNPQNNGSGVIEVQTPGLNTGNIEGSFSVGVTGIDPSMNRYAAAGWYCLRNPNGDINDCTNPIDVDDGGTGPSQQTFQGTLSTTLDSFGRGCFANLSFTINGHQYQGYLYAYYIVSAAELAIISTDPLGGGRNNNANLTLWSTHHQIVGVGFNNGTLGTPTLVELGALDTNPSPMSDVTAGLFTGQPGSTNTCQSGQYDTATFTFDENQGGNGPGQQIQTVTGTYCVDENTGRVTLQGFNGIWATNPPVFYINGGNGGTALPGFAVGTDAAVSAGYVETQTGAPYSNASIIGGYWGGTVFPALSMVTDSVTSLFADGGGDITGTQVSCGPSGCQSPSSLTLSYTVDNTGRAVVTQNGNEFGVLYVVSASKVVLVPSGSNPALNVFLTGQ